MLKQAMTKLDSLNNEILRDFQLDQEDSAIAFKNFKCFTEELVPRILRELRREDQTALSPSLVALLGDCAHKPVNEIIVRCAICCTTLGNERYINIHVQDINLVEEFESGVSRLTGHLHSKHEARFYPECLCDDAQYVASELRSVQVISKRITAKVNDIFSNGKLTGLILQPSIQRSAVFLPDYPGCSGHGILGRTLVDCLGRNFLHRHLDCMISQDDDRIGDARAVLGIHADLRTGTDLLGRTPLHIAMEKNCFLTTAFGDLLRTPLINVQTLYGHTPLHYLAIGPTKSTSHFKNPATCAKPGIFRYLETDVKDDRGKSALSIVIEKGNLSRVKFFTENFYINTNPLDDAFGASLIIKAIEAERIEVLDYLFGLPQVDVNYTNCSGNTLLHYVVEKKSRLSLMLLGNCKELEWNKANKRGETALHYAAGVLADKRILDYFSKHQASIDVNAKDRRGQTPLHWAAGYPQSGNVSILLNFQGVDVNAQDDRGRTPLMHLLCNGWRERISEFYPASNSLTSDSRINLDVKDNDGRTIIDLVQLWYPEKCAQIIPYLKGYSRQFLF